VGGRKVRPPASLSIYPTPTYETRANALNPVECDASVEHWTFTVPPLDPNVTDPMKDKDAHPWNPVGLAGGTLTNAALAPVSVQRTDALPAVVLWFWTVTAALRM